MTEPAEDQVVRRAGELRDAGAHLLIGAISDSGGVLRAKAASAERIEAFARSGMGASLTWPVFCVDNWVAITDDIGVVGDLRLTADLNASVMLDDQIAWAPADVRDQAGQRSPLCWRDVARRQAQRFADLGIDILAAFELEFTITDEDGNRLGDKLGWPAYGLGPLSEHAELAIAIVDELAKVGLPVEQFHAEYGTGQLELSLPRVRRSRPGTPYSSHAP